ncbi:AfsR/SARP family transcriptional regulator [Sphaerisporangium corydalis]|uniref:BTAD domain-containing putative transcriptional regulator n=1 Tax=Sphaerisporangium corydalis TaxID=1441875 RepID=A0ABV9EAK9_9ACTN|nr:BTAD domain-containing putative transcriptional regulator [Sphaerisporangium corydalis]
MRIAVLGSFEVRDDDGTALDVSGPRLRRLLAALALPAGRAVATASLIDDVWGDDPPAGALRALQSLVSRLRQVVPVAVEALPYGYRMAGTVTDVREFERSGEAGRHAWRLGDAETTIRELTTALRLWRGVPFTGLGPGFAPATAARLTDLHLSATEDLLDARLTTLEQGLTTSGRARNTLLDHSADLPSGHAGDGPGGAGDTSGRAGDGSGCAGDVAAEVAALVAAHPLRERLHGLRMRALRAAGRPAEALEAFEHARATLADRLGADPSPALRALHLDLLRDPGPEERGPGRAPGNLRAPLTSFVGRDAELAQVGDLLATSRLVTLAGPGGVGKTRLATEAAAAWAHRTGEGAWLVELAGVRDPLEITGAVLTALGVREAGGDGGRLVGALRDRRLLVVLDNCEHLIDACARIAEDVLGECPGVRVLATSREPLSIAGESIVGVGRLAVPPPGYRPGDASSYPAIRLFADRAALARPGFTIARDDEAAVVEICRRLDGLPLAIELACARLRSLPVTEIRDRLGDRFRLLTGGSRTVLPRHQTLEAVVAWSWDLLTGPERRLARRLAVFTGGATVESAEAVCADDEARTGHAVERRTGATDEGRAGNGEEGRAGDGEEPGARSGGADREEVRVGEVLDLLRVLVDKSLVELVEVPGAPARYRMLDTIRDFTAARLVRAGESGRVRQAHAYHFLAGAEAADLALRGPDQLRHLAWLTREHDNLTTALRWAVDDADAEAAGRLCTALGWFWVLRGDHAEAATWLEESLALDRRPAGRDHAGPGERTRDSLRPGPEKPGPVQPEAREPRRPGAAAGGGVAGRVVAGAQVFAAMHHSATHRPELSVRASEEAQRLADAGTPPDHPVAVVFWPVMKLLPRYELGAALEGLSALADHPDPWVSAAAVLLGGLSRENSGDAAGALVSLEDARKRFLDIGDRWGVATATGSLGYIRSLAGDHAGAIAAMAEARGLAEVLGAEDDVAVMLAEQGVERMRSGDLAGARADLTRSLSVGRSRGSRTTMAFVESALGELAMASGDLPQAGDLLDRALEKVGVLGGLPPRVRALTLLRRARLSLLADPAYGPASVYLREAVELARRSGDRPIVARAAETLAEAALAGGRPVEAGRMLGLAEVLRGMPDHGSPEVRKMEAGGRAAAAEAFTAARASAAALSPDAALAALLDGQERLR